MSKEGREHDAKGALFGARPQAGHRGRKPAGKTSVKASRTPDVRRRGEGLGAGAEVVSVEKERSKQDARNTSKEKLTAFRDGLE